MKSRKRKRRNAHGFVLNVATGPFPKDDAMDRFAKLFYERRPDLLHPKSPLELELIAMVEEAIRIFDLYLNVPESVALKARWEALKKEATHET